MRICYSGLRFFYQRALAREWKIFALLRARRELRRPCVLSRHEVHRILEAAYPFQNQVYFTTVYSCGLRLHEGLHLEIGDIDSQLIIRDTGSPLCLNSVVRYTLRRLTVFSQVRIVSNPCPRVLSSRRRNRYANTVPAVPSVMNNTSIGR